MKRTVFLLGAGAAIDWSGPSTQYLTDFLRDKGPKNRSGNYITNVLLDKFNERLPAKEKLNFEGLIDIVEQCFQYWSNSSKGSATISKLLIDRNHSFWSEVTNLDYINTLSETRSVSSIKKAKITDEAKFFAILLVKIYAGINEQISNYGRCNAKSNKIGVEETDIINQLASDYFSSLSGYSYLRIYSLNYDRVIQFLFRRLGLQAFQGFYPDLLIPEASEDKYLVDTKRILTSFNEHCIYHLHGNYAWGVEGKNCNKLDGYSVYNGYWGNNNSNNNFYVFESEKNKPLFLSNIVTGYSKTQRTNLTPFKQMASAFDMDCHQADEIIIVGYSFGDLHINDTIRQAKKANKDCKITVVTYAKDTQEEQKFRSMVAKSLLSDLAKYNQLIFDNGNKSSFAEQFNLTIIFKPFKKYLESVIKS